MVIGMKVKVMVMLELMMIGMLKQASTTTPARTTPNERCMSRTDAMHARFESWYTFWTTTTMMIMIVMMIMLPFLRLS